MDRGLIAMELRHLRYFVAVAEEQSFTRAAERLWIAQPGLSQQIRMLERELGVRLFERLSRGVELTDAGRVFLEKARAVLIAAEEAVATGRNAGVGALGSIRLGFSPETRWGVAPRVLDALRAERPRVGVTVIESEAATLLRDVRDARLDAVFVLSPVARPGLESLVVCEEPAVVAIASGDPLAGAPTLTAAQLEHHVVALSGDRDSETYDRLVMRALGTAGEAPRTRASGYGSAFLGPVLAGQAVALLPASYRVPPPLVLVPFEPRLRFRFELAWREGHTTPLHSFLRAAGQAVTPAPRGVASAATRR